MTYKEETYHELQDYLMALKAAHVDFECEIARLQLKCKENEAGQCEMINRLVLIKRKGK